MPVCTENLIRVDGVRESGESYRLATSKKAQRRSAQGHGQNPKIPNEGETATKK
jgi:hypothetical protein